MSIKSWPAEDRPREKLIQKGGKALTDAELIAIFLKTGIKGSTALDLAKKLLQDYGGLKKLLSTPLTELIKYSGIGLAKFATLKAALELGRRYQSEPIQIGSILKNSTMTRNFLSDQLREHKNEVFACLFMDNNYRIISFEELFQGTINRAMIYPREIVRRGLLHNAAKIILAHNHPSNVATPSDADKEVTLFIREALNLVDIEVVDHIIVGNPENFSFAEAGLM